MKHLQSLILIAMFLILGGCERQRVLRWSSPRHERLEAKSSIAIVELGQYELIEPYPQVQAALATELANHLIRGGWDVRQLPESREVAQGKARRPLAASEIAVEPMTEIDSKTDRKIQQNRLQQAKEADARYLLELAIIPAPQATVVTEQPPTYEYPYQYYYPRGSDWQLGYAPDKVDHTTEVTWNWNIRSAAVRITDVATGEVVSTISLRYKTTRDDVDNIAQDLMMGFHAIQSGRESGTVRMNTAPGHWPEDVQTTTPPPSRKAADTPALPPVARAEQD